MYERPQSPKAALQISEMVLASYISRRDVWLLVFLLSISHLSAFVDRFVFAVVASPMKAALKLSDTDFGVLQGLAFALAYTAAIIPLGRLADRISARRLIIFGIAVWTAAGVACAFAGSFAELCSARMLMGVGQAAFTPAALGLIGGCFTQAHVARPMSIFTAGSTLGKSVAFFAGGTALALLSAGGLLHGVPVLARQPWRGAFVLTSAPNLLLILGFLLLRAPPSKAVGDTSFNALFKWISTRRSSIFSHVAMAIAPIVIVQAAAAWGPIFYSRYFGLTVVHSAFLVGGAVLIAAPLGHLIGGQLTTICVRRGLAPAILIALMLLVLIPAALLFCFSGVLWISLAAYGAMVLMLGVAGPAGLVGVRILTPRAHLGAANAFFMGLVTLIGVGLGPALVGFMSDGLYGGPRGLNLSMMTLVAVICSLCLALAAIFHSKWLNNQSFEGDTLAEPQECLDP